MFISVGNSKIFTTSFGSKKDPIIVGVGGWIGSWELWVEPFSHLSQSWYTIGYDHRGAGATIAPIKSITFDQQVEDVFSVMDAYSIEQCVLAGESAGAMVVLQAALKHPDRITGLVIVDGLYYRETPPDKDSFLQGLKKDYTTTLDYFVEACVPGRDFDHIKRWGRQIIDRASSEAAIALYLSCSERDFRSELHHIQQPVLVIQGELDNLVPLKNAQWLYETLPNAKLTVLKGAGHIPTMTHPVEIADEILRFFKM